MLRGADVRAGGDPWGQALPWDQHSQAFHHLLPPGTLSSLVVVSRGFSLVAVCRLLIAVASLVAEQRPQGTRASVTAARGLSSCGFWALEHRLNSCGTQAWLL